MSTLGIITGRGRHSAGGQPRVKPAVSKEVEGMVARVGDGGGGVASMCGEDGKG